MQLDLYYITTGVSTYLALSTTLYLQLGALFVLVYLPGQPAPANIRLITSITHVTHVTLLKAFNRD
jgi:hypothetical protein